uniref:F-box protein 21 n=1 Tax=Callorhinchus milii TaxID=7868 RepID=A0A4W3HTS1_CALMI
YDSNSRRLRSASGRFRVAQAQGLLWKVFFSAWPTLLKHYSRTKRYNWWEEYRTRHSVGLQVRKIVETFSKRFFAKEVPVDGFRDIEALDGPCHFIEDELVTILNMDRRKYLTSKYYTRKILYYIRQKDIMEKLKEFLSNPPDMQRLIEGAVLIDQYLDPLAETSLESILRELNDITEEVKRVLRLTNSSHPSIAADRDGDTFIDSLDLQRQALVAMNSVLYKQLKFSGNEDNYLKPVNFYIHQVLREKEGIRIALCVLYSTIGRNLGIRLEPVSFLGYFLLRWCQKPEGSTDFLDYVYIDAFDNGKLYTAKECECLLDQPVATSYYSPTSTKNMLLCMATNLFHRGKENASDESYQLLGNTLDLYVTLTTIDLCLTLTPDDVQYLMLPARLYFQLGINPEKILFSVLDILQRVQVIDPSHHNVGHMIQLTLEQIARKNLMAELQIKHRTNEKHREVAFSVGLIMKHKRYGYDCVICGWDPKCMMEVNWMRNMGVYNLPNGPNQPFYNVLVQDGSCRYAAQENLVYNPAPLEIGHEKVGRYFSEFTGFHYVANVELQMQYPSDLASTSQTVQRVYGCI